MEDQVIRCESCGKVNKVPPLASGKTAICGNCKSPLGQSHGHPVELADSDFARTIGRGAWVVDFWAAWCGPCRAIAPLIEQLAATRSDVRFGKLNVDENPQTSAFFQVQGIPLLIFFKDGEEKGRLVGAVPKQRIESVMQQYLG